MARRRELTDCHPRRSADAAGFTPGAQAVLQRGGPADLAAGVPDGSGRDPRCLSGQSCRCTASGGRGSHPGRGRCWAARRVPEHVDALRMDRRARPRDRGSPAGHAEPGAGLVSHPHRTRDRDLLQWAAARRAHALIPLTLGALNAMQLPVSFWLTWRGDRMLGRRWPYVVAGTGSVLAVAGYTLAPASTAPLWAGMAGATSSLAFILNLG